MKKRGLIMAEVQVAASLDDDLSSASNHWPTDPASSIYYYTGDPDYRYGWLRLQINIPGGSTIDSCVLRFIAYTDQSGIVSGQIQHTDEDNASNFASSPHTRSMAGPAVDWNNIGAWTAESQYDSPGIKTILQDFIDRPGYNPNQYIAIRLSGIGGTHRAFRQLYQWDGDPAKATKLVYAYTPPTPTVTTQAATAVEATSATGNGNITALNNGVCDIRGFVWDLATHGDPGDVAPGASGYANDVAENNGFGTGAFTGSLTGLPAEDTIYVRAYAHNENGYGYGDEIEFTTKALSVPVADGDLIGIPVIRKS